MASFDYNPINPQCTISPCINQLAGYVDHALPAYIASCQAAFGFPVVPTVTIPSDPIYSTQISTSTYVDIVISSSFEYSTVEETSTLYEYVSETATEYSTTIVNTLTSTVPLAVTTSIAPAKKRGLKRRGCKPRISSSSVASSSAPAPSSSAVPFDGPKNCINQAEFSSACTCIEPQTVTAYAPPSTEVVYSTVPYTSQSTSGTVITVAVTSIVVSRIQTTVTETLTTETETTTTTTTTSQPTALATGSLFIAAGSGAGNIIKLSGSSLAYSLSIVPASQGAPTSFSLAPTWSLTTDANFKIFVRLSTTSYGVVFLTTASYISTSAYTWVPATCSVEPGTQNVTCVTGTYGLQRFLMCGSTLYMAKPTTTPGGCVEIQLTAAQLEGVN